MTDGPRGYSWESYTKPEEQHDISHEEESAHIRTYLVACLDGCNYQYQVRYVTGMAYIGNRFECGTLA